MDGQFHSWGKEPIQSLWPIEAYTQTVMIAILVSVYRVKKDQCKKC